MPHVITIVHRVECSNAEYVKDCAAQRIEGEAQAAGVYAIKDWNEFTTAVYAVIERDKDESSTVTDEIGFTCHGTDKYDRLTISFKDDSGLSLNRRINS